MKNFIKTNGALAKNQNILLCKKSEIENRLFTAALSELRGKVATANTFKELTESLQREQFGLILVDEEISGYSSDVLATIIESLRENFAIDARLFVFSNESHSAGAKDYIKTLSPHISKAQLISVLRHEISDMGGGMRAL